MINKLNNECLNKDLFIFNTYQIYVNKKLMKNQLFFYVIID